jgi:methylenetetrahydrofolate dehydrogenase (NADP+)/methenyltetrahydrofolate cyclohydrolase
MTKLLDGRPPAERIRAAIAAEAHARAARGAPLGLAIVRGGGDRAVLSYSRLVARLCEQVEIRAAFVELAPDASVASLSEQISALNRDASVHGILVTLPLPPPLTVRDVAGVLAPEKDVDGIHPVSAGRLLLGEETFLPATAAAVLELLRAYEVPLQGKHAVVIGRSNIAGKPAALLLLGEHATVTICHTRTVALPAITRQADILVVAAGQPELVRRDWVKPGAVVVDVGTNWVHGRQVGDVCFAEVEAVAAALTPVPGGVGPLTNMLLLRNVVQAAARQ